MTVQSVQLPSTGTGVCSMHVTQWEIFILTHSYIDFHEFGSHLKIIRKIQNLVHLIVTSKFLLVTQYRIFHPLNSIKTTTVQFEHACAGLIQICTTKAGNVLISRFTAFSKNSHIIYPILCKRSTLNTSLPVWRTGIEGTAVQQKSVCGYLLLDTQTCHLWLGLAVLSGTWTRGKLWSESPLWMEAGFGHSHTGHPL